MRKFFGEAVALFFAGFVYGLVVAYLMYHGKPSPDATVPLPLGYGVLVGAIGGVCAIVTGHLARLFPSGLVGRVAFNVLCGSAVFAVAFGTQRPNSEVAGIILIGAGLGLFTGFVESARQQRNEKCPPPLP